MLKCGSAWLKYAKTIFLYFQNVFNSILCLLFSILLALVQFRVIRDSYLPLLCYGIMFFMAAFCFISMPTVGNVFPVDTRDVSTIFLNIYASTLDKHGETCMKELIYVVTCLFLLILFVFVYLRIVRLN